MPNPLALVPLTLRQKQSVFVRLLPLLLDKAYLLGYEATLGEAYRSPEEAARLAKLGKGIKESLHTQRLAIDINLFRDGVYLMLTEEYRPIGEWWEQQSTSLYTCAWGGRFTGNPDGNHFSIAHAGKQ